MVVGLGLWAWGCGFGLWAYGFVLKFPVEGFELVMCLSISGSSHGLRFFGWLSQDWGFGV